MRSIEALELERVGDDLCLVFRTSDGRGRGILGKISPRMVDGLARQFSREAGRRKRPVAGGEIGQVCEV